MISKIYDFLPLISDSEYCNRINEIGEFENTVTLEIEDFYFNGVISTDPSEDLEKATDEIYSLANIYYPEVFQTSWGVVFVTSSC